MRENPYLGPRPFSGAEGHVFFGRKEPIAHILTQLRDHGFTVVVGPAGSGKSSLVSAGVFPNLSQIANAKWLTAVVRADGNLVDNLTAALRTILPAEREGSLAISDLVRDAICENDFEKAAGLVRQALTSSGARVLLLIDQFEEVFRLYDADDQRNFVNAVTAFVCPAQIGLIVTLRSDFLGDCVRFPQLVEMVNKSLYLVPTLSEKELRETILGPVRNTGVAFESGLVDRLVADMGEGDSDSLAALQYVLRRMWRLRDLPADRPKPTITLKDYEEVGGITNAIQLGAEEIYANLSFEEQRVAKTIFRSLTGRDSFGRTTRRAVSVGELAAIADSKSETYHTLTGFNFEGFFQVRKAALADHTIVEIGQPLLMRQWQRLKEWMDQEQAAGRIYRRLEDSALLHEKGEAGLITGPELAIVREWWDRERPSEMWARRYGADFETAKDYLNLSIAQQTGGSPRRAIFVCYRRDDGFAYADTLREKLAERLGDDNVFMDVGIKPGANFNYEIETALATCAILIAVIGNQWLNIVDESGRRRLENAEDYVVREILTAKRREVSIIPVVFGNAKIPEARELPAKIQFLATQQAIKVSHGNYHDELAKLVNWIAELLEKT